MPKVQFIVGGQIKDVPPKMADLLIRIGKCRAADTGYEIKVAIPISPPIQEIPEISARSPEFAPVEPSVPAIMENADHSNGHDEPRASLNLPTSNIPAAITEAEDGPEEVSEVRQKRRYRRRNMTAED